jgi:hypothetical protein
LRTDIIMNVASSWDPSGQIRFATPSSAAHLSRLAKAGRAAALARGIYAVGATLPPERIVRTHRHEIIAHYWPGAVLCDRTALDGGEPVEGWMFVCHREPARMAPLHLPGLSVAVRVGPDNLPGDMPMPCGLYLSGPVRTLLENVGTAGRPAAGRPARQAGTGAVDDRIDELARTGGAGKIQNLLAQLDVIASYFPPRHIDLVRGHLAAVLGTVTDVSAVSPRLAARLAGRPYDQHRIDMFVRFAELLSGTAPVPAPALGGAKRWEWLPFFESYFSNFIEGTEFSVEEARRIAVDGEVPADRPADAHDVAATYRIASDPELSRRAPSSAAELIDALCDQHAILMAARQNKRPGQFKVLPNSAGGYLFVPPELVVGTLTEGFNAFATITDPFQRAAALMLLVTECHPFVDGNGRISRLIANAALSAAGQVRMIIPTAYRSNYLSGLGGVSNGAGRGETLVAVLAFAQKWTARVDWTTFEIADQQLHDTNAYEDAGRAELEGRGLRLP